MNNGDGAESPYDKIHQLGLTSHLHSFILQQDGQVLKEEYFNGGVCDGNPFYKKWPHAGGRHELHFMLSVTKTMSGFAMARAIQKNYVNMDAPLVSYLDVNTSELATGAHLITVKDAMCMKSGLRPSAPAYGNLGMLLGDSPPVQRGQFKYQDSDPTLLWHVMERACPGGALKFLENEVFGPLGIHGYQWDTEEGVPKGGAGLFWKAQDMLTVGQVMLDGGKYNGQQFVPLSYVEGAFAGTEYDHLWHHEDGFSYSAGGGGQYLFVHPAKKLVMVNTGADDAELMGTMIGIFKEIQAEL